MTRAAELCSVSRLTAEVQESINIMLIDNAGIHKAKRLSIPENIRLLFLTSYSPELNPIERFWQYIKWDIKGKNFSGLPEMKDWVADILKKYSPKITASLTVFSYILDAVNI